MRAVTRLYSVLIFHLLCLCVETGRNKRVIGGMDVTCGTQPRVASLRNATTEQHLCVATLLSPHFALTAAHCVLHTADQYVLRLNNYCGEIPTIAVVEVIVHDFYNKYSRAHDIALIRISHVFDDTAWLNHTILPKSSLGLSGECTMFGYGYKYPGVAETSETLMAGAMSIVSLDDCWKRMGQFDAPTPDSGVLCAMGAGGVDACQGDSGGPLICSGLVQAVSSYGMSCGVPGLPGFYTSVGQHLQWINEVINENC